MEDLNELYKLLERADAAGDDESVATLIPYIKQVETAAASQSAKKEPVVDVTQPQPDLAQPPVVKPADDSSDFFRGMRAYLPETKATLSGAEALLGKQIGSEKLMRAGVKGYEEASKELAPLSRDTDTIQGAIDKGISAVVTDFLPYWAGKGVGMLGEGLAFSILGGVAGSAVPGAGTAGLAITSLVSRSLVKKGLKEAVEKIAKEKGDDAAKSFIEKEASKFMASEAGQKAVNKELGKRVGIGVMAGIHGEGEVMGQAIQHATQTITDPEEKIRAVNDLSTGRLTTAAAGHALGDYFAAKIGLDALDNLASPTKNFVMSVVKNWAITGVKEVPPELLQTALERFGADMPLADKEAINDYINTAAAAFGMSSIPGAYGGISGAVQARKTTETEKPIDTDPLTGEQRPSRETLKKQTLKDLEDKANEINKAKADEAAQLKAAQQQQVVTEAVDLESMPPANPMELTENTLTSWGLSKNSKAYKTLIGQDAGTPEGRALIDTALEAHTGKINEPAVDTYKSLLDQQKVEATNEPQTDTGPGIDTGAIGINNEVPGQPKYGTPGTVAGYNEPTVNIGGTPITLPKRGEADVNAPLEPVAPVVEKAPVEEAPVVSTQPKLASQLRALDSTNPLIEALQYDQASEEEVAVAQDTIKKLQASRKAKKADLTKVSEEEKDIPLEAREPVDMRNDVLNLRNIVPEGVHPEIWDKYLKQKKWEVAEPYTSQEKTEMFKSWKRFKDAVNTYAPGQDEVTIAQNLNEEFNKLQPQEARGEIQNTGETPDTIEATFQKQYGKNVRLAKQRGLLNFLNDVSELPPEVGPVTPGTKAVYHKGKGYFITNRITREDAPRMLLHEIGVHYGLEGMLGTTNYKRVVKQIKQNHLTDKELKASWDNTVKTYPEYPEGSNNFMQEVIANIGETAPNNTIFRQIVGYIKQFLSKLGYGWDINKITADDIRDMVQHSVRMSLAGKIKGAQPGITMKGEEDTGAPKPTYYSQLTRIITNAQFKNNVSTQSGDQWIGWLNSKTSEAGGKRDELEFSGILEFLDLNKSEKFDKQDILTYLEENNTKVTEYMYGEGEGNSYSDKDKEEWVDEGVREWIDSKEESLYLQVNEEAADTYDFPYYVTEEDVTDAEGNKIWRVYATDQGVTAVDDTYYFSEGEAQQAADDYNNRGINDFSDELYEYYKSGIDNQADTVREELADQWDEDHENVKTKYLDWTLDGGDNKYTEVVIALQNPKKGTIFSTDHWRDISNPIVHYRVNARTDTKGNIVLFVEEIQSDWAQAPRKLRKKHIIELAEKWKATTNSKLTIEQISKQIAKFVPGDWGFKREIPPEQQKEYDNISTMLSEKQNKRKLFRDQIHKYHDFEEKLRAYIDHEVRKIISPNINTSRRTTVISELSDDDFKVNSEYNSTRNYYIQTILNKDLSPYHTTIYGYKIDNNIVKQILDQPGVKTNVDQYAKNIKEIDKILYEVESLDEDIKDLELKKRSLSQFGKIDKGPFVQDTEAWSNLVLKNIIRFAAERGYDKVAFVNGRQAAFKGGKAEAIDEVFGTKNKDGTFNIYATLKDGGGKTRTLENIRDLDLEDYIGGLANKFRGLNVGETDGWDAGDLKLPSKGMVEFYDGMILRYAAKLIKKLGGNQLETIELIPPNQALREDQKVGMQRGFAITSAMRDKAMAGQPLFARASKQQLDDDLKNSGTVGKEKEPKPTTFDRFKDKPLKTIDEIIANFRKSFFSFDAAINNKILIAMRQQKIPQQEVAKSFYEMQVGQALHADQLSDMWMVHGGIKYDPESFSFVIEDFKDSMSTIREQLSAIAKKRNISEFEMFQYGHAAFVAQRSQGLNESNEELKKKVLKLLVDGKKAAAREAMDNYKLVSLTPAQIEYGMNFFKTIPELKKIQKTWNKNRRRLLQFAVDYGLYTTEKAEDLLDVIDFVPFYREAQDEDNQIPKPFTRGILDTAIDKRLKGSYRPVNNVFDNMERWASYTLKKAINNKAAQEKIKFYSKYLPDDIKIIKGTSTTGNAVGVWYDGKVVKFEFQGYDGKSMVDGFTGLEPVINLVVPKFLNKYATFQRAQIVLEPLFNAAQITMDAFDALFSSGIDYPVLLPLQVVKEILLSPLGLSKARTYLSKRIDVGKRDWASEYNNIDLEAIKQLKQLKTSDKLIKAVLSPVVASYKGLKFLGMASDNIIRQAVWSQTMLETGDVARATFVAREIINFRRTGSNAYISAARQMAPFVNANLQAANIAFGTMLFSGITPDSKVVQLRRLITSGAQVTAAILILTALNSDDDDYKKLDPKDRDRLLMLPGSGGYALPVRGSIITLIYKILPEHLYNRYIEESEDSEKLRKSLTEAFKRAIALPTGFPTLVTPVLEMALNLDTVTGLPLRGQSQKDLEADLQYSNKYTSQLARWANDATGISPIVVQNFMNRWLASTSMLVSMFTNKLIADIRGEMLPEKTSKEKFLQLPSGNKFVTKQQNTRNINDYYELNDIVNSIVDSANKYKNIDYPKYQEYIAKDNRAEIINMRKEMSVISKELQLLRDYENKIYASKDANRWTPATKKAELDRLEGIRQNMLGSQLQLKERSDRYIQQLRYRGGL